eukprot:gb/GECG01013898.1/.p1 GENE.gb/GECG01013898.1/~~gb/GECG01013898.1/.p1  ORF type:complete len:439 (+),score=37.77 gb/GECG01013898.1/:1-1317(+)
MVLVNNGAFLHLGKSRQGISSRKVLDTLIQKHILPHTKAPHKYLKYGHAGTLDPNATGVLPVALGSATKLTSELPPLKIYRALIELGRTTDTDDTAGTTVAQTTERQLLENLSREKIQRVIDDSQLTGTPCMQVPPRYSAIHVNGERAYDLARKNQLATADLPERAVNVYGAAVRHYTMSTDSQGFPLVEVDILSGSGFYVRSFARDLGDMLGTGGTLKGLDRMHNGGFDQNDAAYTEESKIDKFSFLNSFTEPDYPFRFYPYVVLKARVGNIEELTEPKTLQRMLQRSWLNKKKFRVHKDTIRSPERLPLYSDISATEAPKDVREILEGINSGAATQCAAAQMVRVYIGFESSDHSDSEAMKEYENCFDRILEKKSLKDIESGMQVFRPRLTIFTGLAMYNPPSQNETVELVRQQCIIPEHWDSRTKRNLFHFMLSC